MYQWLPVCFVEPQRNCTSIPAADASVDNRDTAWKIQDLVWKFGGFADGLFLS